MILKNKSSFNALPKRTPVPLDEPLHWVRFFNFNNMEIWKDIPGYEGYYQVSDLGRVRSLDMNVRCRGNKLALRKGKVLKLITNRYGYLYVNLFNKNKKTVHRLVMLAFIGDSKLTVNHIDEDKKNNKLNNLEYMSIEDNVKTYLKNRIHPGAEKNKIKIKDLETGEIYKSITDAATCLHKKYGYANSLSLLRAISIGRFKNLVKLTE